MGYRFLSVFFAGFISIILQIALLRKLLSYFSGNELTIGIIISIWLFGTGFGSYAGRNMRAFGPSFIISGVVVSVVVTGFYVMRLFYPVGEEISLFSIIIITSFLVLPVSIIAGAQFPMAISHAGNPEMVFALESIGAFTGGLVFTFLLTETLDTITIILTAGILSIIAGSLIIKRILTMAFMILPLILIFLRDDLMEIEWKGLGFTGSFESRFGEITLLERSGEYSLYSSGRYIFSYPDPQSEELRSIIPLILHKNPEDILVIGGPPAFLKWYLSFPVRSVTYLEHDRVMLRVSTGILKGDDRRILQDKRLRIVVDDERRYVRGLRKRSYDLIVLNLPLPHNANMNRFYTEEFFYLLRDILRDDGMVVISIGISRGYMSRALKMTNGSIFRTLTKVFAHIIPSSDEYGFIIASMKELSLEVTLLKERLSMYRLKTRFINDAFVDDIFNPFRMEIVRKSLSEIDIVNSDMRPVSYLYNLAIWFETGGLSSDLLLSLRKGMVISFIILIFLIFSFTMRRKVESFLIFTTGYSGMSLSISVILLYQSMFGYLYEMIGLLTALYMSGLAIGSYGGRYINNPGKYIIITEVFLFFLPLLLTIVLVKELSFYIVIISVGVAGGLQFVMASSFLIKRDIKDAPARLYSLDLLGSVIGGITTAVVVVPVTGIHHAFILFSMVKLISLCLMVSRLKG